MSQSKRVILFLVEGVTDETAFGLIMTRILEQRKCVRFKIIGGDITTQTGTNLQNCVNKVVEQVKEFLAQDFYQKGDLLEIIHLVDLDGVFISNQEVIYSENQSQHVKYTEDHILTTHVDSICERNLQKAEVLRKLFMQHEIYGKIPYSVYYFSCNLEHVFYGEQNVAQNKKYELAQRLVDSFMKDPSSFIQFLNSSDIILANDYDSTWEKVQEGVESLHRHSNFHVFLNRC